VKICAFILRWLDIQLENPLTILQQDTAKELLQAERPEKMYEFFESATMLSQCREEYKRSAIELSKVGRNVQAIKEVIVELKNEANKNREIVNEGIKVRKRDKQCEELQKQRGWARVIKKRKMVEAKEAQVDKIKTKKKVIETNIDKFDINLKAQTEKKDELLNEDKVGINMENELKVNVAKLAEERKQKQSEKKLLTTELKKIESKRKSIEGKIKVLENMMGKLEEGPGEELLEKIATLQAEAEALERSAGRRPRRRGRRSWTR
jgi:chromosome segregation ATPase